MDKHPKPEIINGYKIVYPIWRDDLAEAIIMPVKPDKNFEIDTQAHTPAEPQ